MFTDDFLDTLACAPEHRAAALAAARGDARSEEAAATDWLRHIRALASVDAIDEPFIKQLDAVIPRWRRSTPRQLDAEHQASSLPAPPPTRTERLGLTPAQWLRVERIAAEWPGAILEERDRRYLLRLRSEPGEGGGRAKPGLLHRLDRRLPGWRTRDLTPPRTYPAVIASYLALARDANLSSRGTTTTMWLARARAADRNHKLPQHVTAALDAEMPGWRTLSAAQLDNERRDHQIADHGLAWYLQQLAEEGGYIRRSTDRERLGAWRSAERACALDPGVRATLDRALPDWRKLARSTPADADDYFLRLAERGELAASGSHGRAWLSRLKDRDAKGQLSGSTAAAADRVMPGWRSATPRQLDAAFRARRSA